MWAEAPRTSTRRTRTHCNLRSERPRTMQRTGSPSLRPRDARSRTWSRVHSGLVVSGSSHHARWFGTAVPLLQLPVSVNSSSAIANSVLHCHREISGAVGRFDRCDQDFPAAREDQCTCTTFQPAAALFNTSVSILCMSTGLSFEVPVMRASLATHARSPTVSPVWRCSL